MCKAEFEQGLPAKDHNYHLEFAAVFYDFFDIAAESAERTVGNLDGLADLEVDFDVGGADRVLVLLAEDALGLFVTNRHRDTLGCIGAGLFRQESGYVRDVVADDVFQFRGKLRVNEDIAREKKSVNFLSLAILRNDFFLYRDKDLIDDSLEVSAALDLFIQIFFRFLFLASGRPEDIPLLVARRKKLVF